MRRILLTGAAGFVGWKTAEYLLKANYRVIGIDNMNDYYDVTLKNYRLRQLRRRENFTFHKIDIENKTINQVRSRLMGLEGKSSEQYFKQYWKLYPKIFQPKKREKYKAQSPLNNLLNLGYEVLKGEVYKAIMYAHLDPYLGYLHSIQFAKPSLVCDIQEIFRTLIEDFLGTYHQNLEPESFEQKGKRIFLKPDEKLKLILALNRLFKKKVPYKRRNFSKTTTIRTIIKEEPLKLAQYLRGNKIYEPLTGISI